MSDIASAIDALLARLAQTTDPASLEEISSELARLNRQKVLAQPDLSADEWMPIPVLTFSVPAATVAEFGTKEFVKGFFRTLVAGMDADGHSTADEFVTLCRFSGEGESYALSIVCPYEHPLLLFRNAGAQSSADKTRALLAEKSAQIDINHSYGLPEGVSVPVVFSRNRETNEVLLINKHHFSNPKQFIDPARCTTTSGFLNHIGAIAIDYAINDRKEFHVTEPESLMNKGLDDWFRWLYWFIETGTLFEPSRMYVQRANPEQFAYFYGELAPDA
jgi:hypothetical protein